MKPGNKQPRKKDDPSSDDICGDQSGRKRRLPERIAGAKSIEDKELEYRALFETMAPGVFFQRDDGSFVDANPAALKMFGLTFDKFIGKDFYDPQWKVISETNETLIPEQYPSMIALLTGKPVKDMVVGIFNPERDRVTWVRTNATPQFRPGEAVPYQVFVTMDDITDLKRAHTSLAESEERSRNVFEWSNDAILLHTLTEQGSPGHFIDANQVACRMLGYSRDELITLGPSDIVPVEFHPHLGEIIRQSATNESVLFETRLLRKDGTILPVESSGHLVTYEGKKIWLSHIRDITERRNVQDALKESEEKLAMVIDGVPILIAYVDTELRFVYMNKAYADWDGRTREELIGNRVEDLLEKDVFERALPAYRAALSGKTVSMENCVRDKCGNERFVSIGLVPHFSGEDVRGFFASIMDITDRRVAESALTESEVKFRTMVEASPDMIWEIDPQGNFTYISSQSMVQLGYEPGELIGQSIFSIILPESVSAVRVIFLQHIQEEGSFSRLEVPAYHKDGSQRIIEVRSVPITGPDGKSTGFRGIARDITTQKVSEEALIAMSAYNRSLIEVSLDPLVTISHDGKIQDVNSATEKVTGYPRSELIGTDFSDYFVDKVKAREVYQEVFCKGIVRDYLLEIRHRNGSITAVLYNATLYRDPQGKPSGIFAAARDITHLKAAQDALQYSEQKYRDLAELMPQTIFETDLKGRFTYANRYALNLFGYESSDLERGLQISQMVVPDDVERTKHNLEDIVKVGKKSGNEYRFLLKNGGTFTGITYLSIIEKEGCPVGLRGTIADISERKHNEDILRLSHSLLDCANRTPDLPTLLQEYVHIIKDYSGCEMTGIRFLDEKGNIPYQAYCGFSDDFYSTDSLLSMKSDECMCIDVIRGTTDPTQAFFTQGGSFYMNSTTKFLATVPKVSNVNIRNAYNKTGYESVALVPVRQGDRIIGLIHLADRRENRVQFSTVLVIEEIAGQIGSAIQRVGAETQVRESLAEKEVLLREIHHRVKNNLARVISLVGLQKAQLTDPDDIARFRDLESRIRSMSLVHESLYHSDSLSRINAQKYAEDLVQHLIQAYGPRSDIRWNIQMGNTNLPIDTAIHCGLIITEIVTNSLKYAFPEGWSCQEERGEPCKIALSMTEKDGFIILNASDNGRGIPPGSTGPTPRSLGLSLIRILAKNQLHGELEMRTTRGTSFEVRFVREPDWIKGD